MGNGTHDPSPTGARKPLAYAVEIRVTPEHGEAWIKGVLQTVFRKKSPELDLLLVEILNKGSLSLGCFPKDAAETKIDEAMKVAHLKSHRPPMRVIPFH